MFQENKLKGVSVISSIILALNQIRNGPSKDSNNIMKNREHVLSLSHCQNKFKPYKITEVVSVNLLIARFIFSKRPHPSLEKIWLVGETFWHTLHSV